MVTALAFAAATWGIAMAVSPVLQIRKIVQHRSSHGVSVGYMCVLFVGFILWLAYGIALGNWAMIVPNVVAAVVIVATMAVARHYRHRGQRTQPDDDQSFVEPSRPSSR